MAREKIRYAREQLHVHILANQSKDLETLAEILGKSKTDIVIEALGHYLNSMRQQGVL